MKPTILLLPLLVEAVAAKDDKPLFKRAVSYVTVISTTNIPVAQYLAGQVSSSSPTTLAAESVPAVTAAAGAAAVNSPVVAVSSSTKAATTSSSRGGLLGWLSSLFGSDDTPSDGTTAAATTPVTTAAATTPVTTAAAATTPVTTADAPVYSPEETTSQVTSLATSIDYSGGDYTFTGSVSTKAGNWWDGLFGFTSTESAGADSTATIETSQTGSASTGAPLYPSAYSSNPYLPSSASSSSPSTSSSSPSSSSSSSSSSSGSSSSDDYGDYSGIVEHATKAKGITYSPYIDSGSCKSADQVATDFEKLTPFTLIRLYSTDCSGVENTLANLKSHQKLFLGIYNIDTETITSGLSAIKSAVEDSPRGWSAVDTISIGNEQVNDGKASVSDIAAALSTARSWLKSNAPKYTGSVVTVDTLVAVKSNPGLCDLSDYLAVNCHPYWDGNVDPSNAGAWLMNQIASLKAACNNNQEIFITETGWPNKGSNYGSCVPSIENEEAAFKSISEATTNYLAFTMYNDPWKPPGTYGVESNWGIFGASPA